MVGGYHIKANWTNQSLVKLFIDLCLEEESKHRPVYYRWDNIGKIILEKKGLNYNQQQLKRKWITLQKKYRAWINLVAKATDYGSNPTADHRNWSTERWDNYIKKHPDAKPFRYRGLEYEEEMKKLFDGTIPTNTAQSDTSNEELSHGSGGEELSSQAAKESSQMNSD